MAPFGRGLAVHEGIPPTGPEKGEADIMLAAGAWANAQFESTTALARGPASPLRVLQVAEDALRRADALIDGSPQKSLRACRSGCSACCRLAVSVTVPEALRMAQWLRQEHDAASLAQVRCSVSATRTAISHLTIEQRAAARVACALLGAAGECTIYPARPIGCRGFTSFSSEACTAALQANQPGHSGPMDKQAWAGAAAVTEGLIRALRQADVDAGHYELHGAVQRALEIPDAGERWLRGEDLFGDCPRVRSQRIGGPHP